MTRRIRVDLGPRTYSVAIAPGILDTVGQRLERLLGRRVSSAMIVSNDTVWTLYGNRLVSSLERAGFRPSYHLIGDGERFKRLSEVERAIGHAITARIERGEPIVALGGGVVGDLTGLVAALYMRGTPFVQVPTTLLAQIDSSVGGKVGVNHAAGKNLIGAFHQPLAVYADPTTLGTLPARELRAGLYEAIKYGILGDRRLFGWIEGHLPRLLAADPEDLAHLAAWCCRIKARIVEKDERESGLRRILNLGHTAGHALEAVTRYRRFLHGEAVGYGIDVAADLAARLEMLSQGEAARIHRLVERVGERPAIGRMSAGALVETMRHDKKGVGGRIGFVLPTSIGTVVFRNDISESDIHGALGRVLGVS